MKEFLDMYRYLAIGDIDNDVFISLLTKIEGTMPVKILVDHFKKELKNDDSSTMKRIIHTLVALELELTDTDADEHVTTTIDEHKDAKGYSEKLSDMYAEAFGEIISVDATYSLRKNLLDSIKQQIPSMPGFRTKDVANLIIKEYKKAGIKISEASANVYARKYLTYLIKQGVLEEKTRNGLAKYTLITDSVEDKTVFEKFQNELLAKANELDWHMVKIEEIEDGHFPGKTATQFEKAFSAMIGKNLIRQHPPKVKELEQAKSENKQKPKGYIEFF